MSRPHVVLATATRIGNEDFDEAPLRGALAGAGIEARVLAWDDVAAREGFAEARARVPRSTWNYVQNLPTPSARAPGAAPARAARIGIVGIGGARAARGHQGDEQDPGTV